MMYLSLFVLIAMVDCCVDLSLQVVQGSGRVARGEFFEVMSPDQVSAFLEDVTVRRTR